MKMEKAKKAARYETPEYAYCNLGRVFELKRLWPLAIKEYEKALKINPDYSPASTALQELLARLN